MLFSILFHSYISPDRTKDTIFPERLCGLYRIIYDYNTIFLFDNPPFTKMVFTAQKNDNLSLCFAQGNHKNSFFIQ